MSRLAAEGGTQFTPVWISSVGHLDTFAAIWTNASILRKLVGAYAMPPEFPQLQMWWGLVPFPRLPIVYFATGTLVLRPGVAQFETRPRSGLLHSLGCIEKDLKRDFNFQLRRDDVTSIEPYQAAKPFMKYFALPWVRVRTSLENPVLSDFLIAVGGTGPLMGGIRKLNQELSDALRAWQA